MIGVLSVDDHPLLREGIAALVNAESDMKLIAEATNGQEAIEKFRLHRPDVTLMDLQMPALNGIEAMIGIRSEFPNARIIVLTTYAGDVQVLRALKAGARGYILKDTCAENSWTPFVQSMPAESEFPRRSPPNWRNMPQRTS
jgi:DNA-binding NarL/FixJ family response regulator